MAGPGLLPESREDQDERYNPGSSHARDLNNREHSATNREFNDIANNFGETADSTQEDNNIAKVKSQEETAPWKTSLYGGKQSERGRKLSGANIKAILKKRGPLGLIVTILLGGGLAGTLMFAPGLLIINMKEVMVNKFNTQLASMDTRYNKVISHKISTATAGFCGATITVKCKYATMGKTQLEKFAAAKIEVKGDPAVSGRTKPKSFVFNGKEIPAADFAKALKTNPEFNSAVRQAYNPRYAGFIDKIWNYVKAKFGLSKGPPKAATSDKERAANLDEETHNGMKDTARTRTIQEGAKKDPNCTKDCATYGPDDVKAAEKSAAQFTEEANAAAKSGQKSGQVALTELSDAGVEALKSGSKATSIVKATGPVDIACQAYGAVQAVGYAAKTVRAVQLARYAMAFLRTADMMKAGTATPGDVAYMGGILTEVAYDAKSAAKNTEKLGAATDSFGYKYAAYGDTSAKAKSMNLASQFLVGGGLTGDLINFTSLINSSVGGAPKEVCHFLGQPLVSAASLVGGVAMLFVPGVNVAKVAASVAAQATFSVGLMILPELLKDIVAGTVADSNTKGQASGDAITSGSGVIMSELAARGANAPLTPDEAVTYNNLQNDTLAQYAQADRLALSPLDVTNSNTFMGGVVAKIVPSLSNVSSVSGALGSVGSIFSTSIGGLLPTSHAISTAQYKQSLELCQDPDYNNIDGHGKKVATDPFCNVIYGLPQKYLDKDPGLVIDQLIAAGDLDPNTDQPLGKYAEFKKNCIDRSSPLGDQGSDQQQSSGAECFITDENANYYLHAVDQRVNDGMGDDLGESTAASTSGSGQNSGNVNPNGWSFPTVPGAQIVGAFGTPRGTDSKGNQMYHTGVDLNVPAGSPFYATRDGVVKLWQYNVMTVNNDGGAWCAANGVDLSTIDPIQKDIWIEHDVDGQKYASVYGHMSSYVAKDGDHVKAGDLIGYTGGSGCSKGPHVHFEIWKSYPPDPGHMTAGRTLDPTPLIFR